MNKLIKQEAYQDRFNPDVQFVFLRFVLTDIEIYKSCRQAVNEEYFDARLSNTINLINKRFDETGTLPDPVWLRAVNGLILLAPLELKPGDRETYTAELDEFVKYKAMQNAAMNNAKLIEEGKFAEAEAEIIEARKVSITSDDEPFATLAASQSHTVKPPTYFIKPWLMRNTVTAVYGKSQAFKSFWCLQAALCIATGTEFDGYPVNRGSVWYIAAEGETGMGMRLEAWKTAHPDVTLSDEDMTIITQPIDILDPDQIRKLIQMIQRRQGKTGRKCEILFIDTLSQCTAGGDENEAKTASIAVREMIRLRRELDCTVVFVHHTGKDEARGMRGSYAYFGNSDGVVEIDRDDSALTAVARVHKMKDGPAGQEIPFGVVIQKVPAFAGNELDSSLVVTFDVERVVGEDKLRDNKKEARQQKKRDANRREVFNLFDLVGKSISVPQIAKAIWYDNSVYKQKVADAFDLLHEVAITDEEGSRQGVLIREPVTGQTHGAIRRIS